MHSTNTPDLEYRREKARALIVEALRIYNHDPSIESPDHKWSITSGDAHAKLTSENIIHGVVAFLLFNKMAAGSSETIDLYQLLQAYLLDLDKRSELNNVIYGRQ